jgi:trk system potassium uptake protein TrkA
VRLLSAEEHDLTLIDVNGRTLESMVEQYDMMAVRGNCASMEVLLQAGIRDADLLIAVTGEDELNLLSCITARGLNPKLHTIARIRDPEYTEQIHRMQDLFGLSMTVNPEKQAAREIERLIKFPGFLRRDSFAKGRTEIVELRVDDQSRLKDVQLMEIYKIVK